MVGKRYVESQVGVERKEETKGLIMEIQGDCSVMKSYKVDGHNGELNAIMCSQCHVTPMGSYMVRSRKSRVLVETDRIHGAIHLIGCPSS